MTSLVGGTRISKDHLKIESYGTVDELNAWIGVLRDLPENLSRKDILKEIQDRLFTIGADLAAEPEQTKRKIPDLFEADVVLLEKEMDRMNDEIPPLKAFVLPGGHQAVSFSHIARTVCRRAERHVIRLSKEEEINPLVIQYLNRLSDYLFVISRKITRETDSEEVAWKPRL